MVCGLCHRIDTDHSLSTSGPQRCKYDTHRLDCPGGFRTKCSEHILPNNEPKADQFIEDLSNGIVGLHIVKPESETKTSTDLMALSTNQLQWLGLHPSQLQQLAQLGVELGQSQSTKQSSPSTPSNAHMEAPTPMSAPAALSNTTSEGVFTPQPQNIAMLTPASLPGFPPVSSGLPAGQPSSSPGPTNLAGIEELVRHHVVQNQQTLQQYAEQPQMSSYTGPTMPEIRRDPHTQDQVSRMIDLLKNASPVFGQAATNIPQATPSPTQGLAGSYQLQHLQQLMAQQMPPPQQMPLPQQMPPANPSPAQVPGFTPLQQLQQLLGHQTLPPQTLPPRHQGGPLSDLYQQLTVQPPAQPNSTT